jgi:hypothetical protein
MEVFYREQVVCAFEYPTLLVDALASRAMTVSAKLVPRIGKL